MKVTTTINEYEVDLYPVHKSQKMKDVRRANGLRIGEVAYTEAEAFDGQPEAIQALAEAGVVIDDLDYILQVG